MALLWHEEGNRSQALAAATLIADGLQCLRELRDFLKGLARRGRGRR